MLNIKRCYLFFRWSDFHPFFFYHDKQVELSLNKVVTLHIQNCH